MIWYNSFLSYFALFCFLGCSTPKKLQRTLGFSDNCLKSYQYFKERIVRKNEDLLEFKAPTLDTYEQLLTEYYENNSTCWLETLSEKAVIDLFGAPHVEEGGDRTKSLIYYIRTKQCMSLDIQHRRDEKCGTLMFSFSNDGTPIGGVFHALQAAKLKP